VEGQCGDELAAWDARVGALSDKMARAEAGLAEEQRARRALAQRGAALERRAEAAEAQLALLHSGLAAMGGE
jgi:hypothetical protein